MELETGKKGGYFINGKAQVLEMMQYLTPEERNKLVKNIRARNPQLADELASQSVSFNTLNDLSERQFSVLFRYVQAPVLGVALKSVETSLQRKILSLAPRNYAEAAFGAMTGHLSNEEVGIKRAREKVKGVLVSLFKKGIIS